MGNSCDTCCLRDQRYEMKLLVSGNTLKLYPTIKSIISSPEQLRLLIKTQAVVRGHIGRRYFKTLRAQKQWEQLDKFDYGKKPNDIKQDGIMDGQLIVENKLLDDGAYYCGQLLLLSNTREGKGKNVMVNGSIYEGWYRNNTANGKGRYINSEDQSIYEGNWEENHMHGQGKFTWKDGSQFVGQFFENKIHGFGTLSKSDGFTYAGDWIYGEKNGYGKLTQPDGIKYEGEFVNNQRHGQGTQIWPDGSKYVGAWQNGMQNGLGKFIEKSGETKVGVWEEGYLDCQKQQLSPTNDSLQMSLMSAMKVPMTPSTLQITTPVSTKNF